jgi:CRP/FNR family transcriptional regulator, cyclic AMP receptor protein
VAIFATNCIDGTIHSHQSLNTRKKMNLLNLIKNSENTVEYRQGEVIFFEGTHGDMMYVILDGEVEIIVNNNLVDVLKPGNIFGEMALIEESFRSTTTIARTD